MQNSTRFEYLDSIRGLAAFSVLIYHVICAHWGYSTESHLMCMIFNGSDAVSLFFVLSGLVLSYKPLNSNELSTIDYPKYVIARVFRIYPAFLFMLIIYYLFKYQDILGYKFFYDTIIHNKYFFLEEATLLRVKTDLFLPDWTLGVEVAISLILPMLIVFIKNDKKTFWMFLPVFFILNKYLSIFIFHFALGVIIAHNFNAIKNYNFRASSFYPYRFLIYFAIFILFSIRHINRIYPFGETYDYVSSSLIGLDLFHFTGIAAALILVIVINSPRLQNILSLKPLVFLGKISYSLYLVHWFIIGDLLMSHFDFFLNFFGSEKKTLAGFIIMATVLSIIAATLIYYLIEKPFIRMGKSLTQYSFGSSKSLGYDTK